MSEQSTERQRSGVLWRRAVAGLGVVGLATPLAACNATGRPLEAFNCQRSKAPHSYRVVEGAVSSTPVTMLFHTIYSGDVKVTVKNGEFSVDGGPFKSYKAGQKVVEEPNDTLAFAAGTILDANGNLQHKWTSPTTALTEYCNGVDDTPQDTGQPGGGDTSPIQWTSVAVATESATGSSSAG